jgi:hypothetical protein
MLQHSQTVSRKSRQPLDVLLLLFGTCAAARAQSGDAGYPTPVFAGEVSGRIAPRDVGDSRRTRHFYTFRGTEGDLVVNLETSELLGDVDVFLATGFRPLVKFTLFGDPARLSKSFYLRKEETLILRVEARDLRPQIGGHFPAIGLVLRVACVPERRDPRVEREREHRRALLGDQLLQHGGDTDHRVGRLASRIAEGRQRVEGAEQVAADVDDIERARVAGVGQPGR